MRTSYLREDRGESRVVLFDLDVEIARDRGADIGGQLLVIAGLGAVLDLHLLDLGGHGVGAALPDRAIDPPPDEAGGDEADS